MCIRDRPYIISKFTKKPTAKCYKDAFKDVVGAYQRLNSTNLYELKSCLASGFPFVFGFTVYDAFESAEVARTGKLNLPLSSENTLGGHAVLAVGYDDSVQRFIVRNSWGIGWGQHGYFTMPYAYLTNPNLADDFWTVRSVS